MSGYIMRKFIWKVDIDDDTNRVGIEYGTQGNRLRHTNCDGGSYHPMRTLNQFPKLNCYA